MLITGSSMQGMHIPSNQEKCQKKLHLNKLKPVYFLQLQHTYQPQSVIYLITNVILNHQQSTKVLSMWKKYDVYKTQDPKELYNNARREFNSPRNEKTVQNDYNSYMLMKKYKQPEDKNRMNNIENSKKYQKNALTKKQQFSSNRYPQEIVTKLIKQNDYLLDELLRYRQEIGEFKQMFARLKRCKSQKYIPYSQGNISIVDQQNINHSNLIQSKLVKDSTLQTSKVNDMDSLKGVKTDMQGQKLHQPKKHMKPSKRALQREIQQQNQKLYTLIQKFGQERDVEKRKRSRLEMSNCAQKLKTLRSHYKRHFCQYKNN